MRDHNIELHIEELVLNGFPSIDKDHFGEAVQRELSRLFSERGMPPLLSQSGALAQLDVSNITLKPNSTGGEIAAGVAQTLYGGFEK